MRDTHHIQSAIATARADLREALLRHDRCLPITKSQIQRIHILAGKTGLVVGRGKNQDDSKYREFLQLVFGAASSKELNRYEAHEAIEHIDSFAKRPPKSTKGG